jgi:hypothetical protein
MNIELRLPSTFHLAGAIIYDQFLMQRTEKPLFTKSSPLLTYMKEDKLVFQSIKLI